MEKVLYNVEGSIAIITLNRPEKLNALDLDVWKLLGEYAKKIEQDKNIRCAIIKGNGEKGFTAILQETSNAIKTKKLFEMVRELRNIFTKFERQPKPVISAVHGYCFGGGVQLILCTDIRLASDDAKFSLLEVQMGMFPDLGGTQRLPRIVGMGAAKELIYTGKIIDAEEALRIRLVDRVLPREKLFEEAMKLAKEISRNAPIAVQNAKIAMSGVFKLPLDEGLELETHLSSITLTSNDLIRGLTTAFNKETRKFEGD